MAMDVPTSLKMCVNFLVKLRYQSAGSSFRKERKRRIKCLNDSNPCDFLKVLLYFKEKVSNSVKKLLRAENFLKLFFAIKAYEEISFLHQVLSIHSKKGFIQKC